MSGPRRRAAIVCGSIVALVASSCGGGELARAAHRRGEALGLDAAERDTFTREVEACVGREPARTRARALAPSTTVAVGAYGEAPAGSAGGLAAIGVIASAVAAGIGYRAYHWWQSRRRGANLGVRAEPRPSPVPRASGAAEPVLAARASAQRGDSPESLAAARSGDAGDPPALETCLDSVTERWRTRTSSGVAPVAPPP